jgi:hypothetical protein
MPLLKKYLSLLTSGPQAYTQTIVEKDLTQVNRTVIAEPRTVLQIGTCAEYWFASDRHYYCGRPCSSLSN